MAARFRFPELKDLPEEGAEGVDGDGFTPLFTGSSGASSPSQGGDDEEAGWTPLFRRTTAEPARRQGLESGAPTPQAAAAPATRPAEPNVVPSSEHAAPAAPEPINVAPLKIGPKAAPAAPPAPKPEPPKVDPKELERIKAQAREEGYREGFAKGEKEARAAWQAKIERTEAMLLSLGDAREALFQRVREDLVRIMCAVPRKILRQALKIDRRAIASLVTSVLEDLPRQERVVVKVSPDDLSVLEEALPDLRRRLGGYTQVEIEPSAQVAEGGAVVMVDGGRIDATIDRQLETFEQRAREWLLGAEGTELAAAPMPLAYSHLTGKGDT